MSKIFFTADTHYGHKNIVRGVSDWDDKNTCRDFKTIDEMNKAIVKKINQTIGEDDILYHLGDWSFGGKENIWNFRKQINCRNIHLILGNHDEYVKKEIFYQQYFESVQEYLEIPDPRDKKGKKKIILFHYPIHEWNGKHKGWIHLHGHSHGNAPKEKNRLDVYLDDNLKIWSIDEIIKLHG